MPMKGRLDIWKILLNYHEIKKNINYQELLKVMKEKPETVPSKDIIELDVSRTPFVKDVKLNREKITNILKGIAYKRPGINYCQGMNYVVGSIMIALIDPELNGYYSDNDTDDLQHRIQ